MSQVVTIPDNAEKLRWNVGTAWWYSTDGITPTPEGDSFNVRLSVLIDGVYLANHYDPPVNGGTMEWDISSFRGRTVTLTLVIEGDGNEWANAWSDWVDITVSEPPGDNIITPAEMPFIIDDEKVQQYGNYFQVSGDWTSESTHEYAILITASDVTLDGGGYLLTGTHDGDASTAQNGILVTGDRVTVQNTRLTGWDNGILYSNVDGGSILDNEANTNFLNGIFLESCSAITVEGNTANDNTDSESGFGIGVTKSQNIDVKSNDVERNRVGIFYHNVEWGNIFQNDVGSSRLSDINIYSDSIGITIEKNSIGDLICPFTDSTELGSIHVGGENNQNIDILNNQISGSRWTGIIYMHVTTGHIIGNTITGSTKNGITLISCDAVTVENNIVTNNNGTEYSTGIAASDSQNIDLKTNTVTGNRAGIFYNNVDIGNILDNDASNNVVLGIGVSSGSSSITIDGNTVQNVVGTETSNGIQVGGENLNIIDVSNNQVSGCSGNGIQYDHVTTGHIVNNQVTGNTMNGINLDACDAVTVEGNTVTGNTGSEYSTGITTFNSQNIDVKSNIVTGNLGGIFWENVNGGNILDNDASNNVVLGIGVSSGSSSITIDGNTVQNVVGTETSNGIQVGGENLNIIDVSNNQVSGCSGNGIQYDHVTTGHIVNNQVTGNTMNGINLDACDAVTVEGNTVTGNTVGVYTGNSEKIILNGNRISENELGVIIADSINSVIFNNYFNNQNNVAIEGLSSGNSWNGEKVNHENIMGGPYIGGNFWETPQHNGYSELNPDFDGDGLCDEAYLIQDGNVDNLPLKWPLPTAQFISDVTSGEVPLTVVFTDASTGPDITSWTWQFNDGSADISEQNPVHSFLTPGEYTITLTVQSSHGTDSESKVQYISVLLSNQQPVAEANGPYTGFEGGAGVTFSAAGSFDPERTPLTYRWDFDNNGEYDIVTSEETQTWDWGGNEYHGYVTLEVSDGSLTATDTAWVDIKNVAPTAYILPIPAYALTAGVEDTTTGNIFDGDFWTSWIAASADPQQQWIKINLGEIRRIEGFRETSGVFKGKPYSVAVSVDDNSYNEVATGTLTQWDFGEHLFSTPQDAQYLKISISQDDGYGVLAEFRVIDQGLLTSAKEDESIEFRGIFTDPGIDQRTYEWNFGDGETQTATVISGTHTLTGTHSYSSAGTYMVTLTVTDDEGEVGTNQRQVVITSKNTAPVLAAIGNKEVNENEEL
ncbi:MAG TPA: NosD domain-containing protein, partial [Methanolinea sp.]|nr:NosD domain-containing protein [Methanolinea sp.]